MRRVLFLGITNSTGSIMAEALLNHLGKGRCEAWSAGSNPSGIVHPKSIETLRRHGIDPSHPYSKSWNEYVSYRFDAVVAVCTKVAQDVFWPVFIGSPNKLFWNIRNPSKIIDPDAEMDVAFDRAFFALKKNIEEEFLE